MLVEKDISTSFSRYRMLLVSAGIGVMLALIATLYQHAGEPEAMSLQVILGFQVGILVFLLGLVAATHFWFRSGIRHLADTQKARRDALHIDALTGAMTRSRFFEETHLLLREGADARVGFIQLDMDNLKVINDSHGHKVGDAALRRLVSVLRQMLPEAHVGRLGGDEFAILLRATPEKAELVRIAEAILEKLREPIQLHGLSLELSATMGVAVAPQDGDCLETLLANADLALYAGKTSGRGRVVAFHSEMSSDEAYCRFIERELRGALLLNELDVHYQTIVDIQGQSVGYYEALLRWHHSYRGPISPAHFIPIAERSTLIDALGEWVLRRACRDQARLGARRINVNVSLVQLRRPQFAHRFLDILREENMPPDVIAVEITETIQLVQSAAEMRNLDMLVGAGIRVSIDDFGSGATSLDYLRKVRFDAIKIDRSYITNLGTDPVAMALVGALANIGRALNLNVVAEGVETEAQMRMVQAAGLTHMQGYLFGKPMPAERCGAGGLPQIKMVSDAQPRSVAA